ncbi:hypothetical protein HDU87_004819 [Geranomyces variabilis]|uniref:Uncharacterized protein n=1 Tax=Geranomyces variabilis TaxID=109894 RepID=A0AAD5TID2_9FUNG|nr:hypothetical protein HDU87_004819 [Geranomyces variabilis]
MTLPDATSFVPASRSPDCKQGRTPASADSFQQPDEEHTLRAFRARVSSNRQRAGEEHLRRINNALRRGQASRVANTLRLRLEYAAFKIDRGLVDKSFQEIKAMFEQTKEQPPKSVVAAAAVAVAAQVGLPPSPQAGGRGRALRLSTGTTNIVPPKKMRKLRKSGTHGVPSDEIGFGRFLPTPAASPTGSRATTPLSPISPTLLGSTSYEPEVVNGAAALMMMLGGMQ